MTEMNLRTTLLLFITSISFALISCSQKSGTDIPANVVTNPNSASGTVDMKSLPVISFEKDFHDFGNLTSGEKVTYSFKFKNAGQSLLVISSVTTSCGCTVSDYPHQPIKPGEGATIDVSFDSEGRHGLQNKTITVFSNTQPPTNLLRIRASIREPEDVN
jgi:hypothetical protein